MLKIIHKYELIEINENLPRSLKEFIDYQLSIYPWSDEKKIWDWSIEKYSAMHLLPDQDIDIYMQEISRLLKIDIPTLELIDEVFDDYEISQEGFRITYSGRITSTIDIKILELAFKNTVFNNKFYIDVIEDKITLDLKFPYYGSQEEQLANLLATFIYWEY